MSIISAVQSEGITLSRIISDIPHDGPALVVYAMIAIFVVLIIRGSRNSGSGGAAGTP